jgi:hypothetical protein
LGLRAALPPEQPAAPATSTSALAIPVAVVLLLLLLLLLLQGGGRGCLPRVLWRRVARDLLLLLLHEGVGHQGGLRERLLVGDVPEGSEGREAGAEEGGGVGEGPRV